MTGGSSGKPPSPGGKPPSSAPPPSQVKPPAMQDLRKSEGGPGTLRKA